MIQEDPDAYLIWLIICYVAPMGAPLNQFAGILGYL